MKTTATLTLAGLIGLIIASCAAPNPAYTPGNTNGIQPYMANPAVAGVSNAVSTAAQAVAPMNPYAVWTDWGIKLVFGVAGAIAAGLATAKNKNAVIDTMAAGVAQAGAPATKSVLDHASDSPHFTTIAAALNDQTASGKAPGSGAPPAPPTP